jgi:hypothetical protein
MGDRTNDLPVEHNKRSAIAGDIFVSEMRRVGVRLPV